jgi:hypothetical protein
MIRESPNALLVKSEPVRTFGSEEEVAIIMSSPPAS